MIQDVQALLDQYWAWLRERTNISELDGWIEITTPYLDRHNDYLQIYVKRVGGGFMLTDDGYVLDDLEQAGCGIDSHKRRTLFETTLRGFGVQCDGNRLSTNASMEDFALQKNNLVQAMLAVNDIFYLASPNTATFFHEDVATWLDVSLVRYTPSVKFAGKSGYDHKFDFVIPKSQLQPERVLRAINRPSRDTAQSMAFSWLDIREVRSPDGLAFAILNDSEKQVPENVLGAICSYDVHPILWSNRDDFGEELSA